MSKVLVADDEYGICEAFSAFLSAEGHEPLIASNGREALQLVKDESPAVAFLDVHADVLRRQGEAMPSGRRVD